MKSRRLNGLTDFKLIIAIALQQNGFSSATLLAAGRPDG
jgi:hypothetical protein